MYFIYTPPLPAHHLLQVYSIVIPVLPFHLEKLGYTGISARLGWILFAYVLIYSSIPHSMADQTTVWWDGHLCAVDRLLVLRAHPFIATFPIAALSERFNDRKISLILGMLALIGSQVLLMESRKYWTMILARFLQGVSSTMVWVVGLALLYVQPHSSWPRLDP